MTKLDFRSYIVLLTLFIAFSSSAITVNISGSVRNIKNTPVKNAEVRISSDKTITTKTDVNGKFVLSGQTTGVTTPQKSIRRQVIAFWRAEIQVALTQPSPVSVTMYTITGKKLFHYTTKTLSSGIHSISLPMKQIGAGYYLMNVQCNGEQQTFTHITAFSNRKNSDVSLSTGTQADLSKSVAVSQVIFDTLQVSAKGYKSVKYPIQSYTLNNINITLESTSQVSRLDNITKSCEGNIPSSNSGGKKGWGSRYWDCCKPHCSWPENTKHIAANCNANNKEIPCYREESSGNSTWFVGAKSGCMEGGEAFMCYSHVPFAVCDKVAYGFAAVPSSGNDACGKCFLLEFDGGFKHGKPKPAHALVKGKKMIVMASNIGHDVSGGQFDLMIPGGGLGAFPNGCKKQWNVDITDENLVGKGFGGFISKCQEKLGWDAEPDEYKVCVRKMCDNLFGNKPELKDLWEGCIWYVEWMHAVDNPTFSYKEIACPNDLLNLYYSSHHPKP